MKCYFCKRHHPIIYNVMQYIYKYQSPIGGITIASDGDSLTGLWFDGQKYFAASLSPKHEEKHCPYSSKPKNGSIAILVGRTPTSCLRYTWKVPLSVSPYGKY